MRLPTNLSFVEFRMLFKFEWYDSMAALVFCPAWGILLAPTHHKVVFGTQISFMYLMKAVDRGLVFVIVLSCYRAQSTGSSLTPYPLPYITSPSIWRTVARSATVDIFFTAFFAHAFRTCQRQRKILAAGQTSVHMEVIVSIISLQHIVQNEGRFETLLIPQCVDFSLCVVNYDGWRTPSCIGFGNFVVKGLKVMYKILFTTPWYGKECDRYVIPPIVKNHYGIQGILTQTS